MVRFTEYDHSYWNEDEKLYAGATTFLSQYKNPFDTKMISERSAARYGGKAEDYVNQWARISKTACDRGTKFHQLKEDALYNGAFWINDQGIEVPVINQTLELLKRPGSHYPITDSMPDGVYPEMLLWSHPVEIAGTADWVYFEGRYFDINDWKTNKVIKTEGFQGQCMLGPLDHLQDCNYTHYCLQISLYAYMLEQAGRTARSLSFTHFPAWVNPATGRPEHPDQDSAVSYPVAYLKEEIQAILEPRYTYV